MTKAMIEAGTVTVETTNLFGESLVGRWIRFAGVAAKSEKTYRAALKVLFKYFATNNIARPSRDDLEIWRDSLIKAGKSPSTVSLYLTSCKLFFRWLALENLYPNIADHLKARVKQSHEHKKDALTATQSAELFRSVDGDDLKARRDRAILSLMLTAGVRTIEVSRADVQDLRYVNGECYLFVQGKGHSAKDQSVKVAPQVEAILRAYLSARGVVADDSPLFISMANRNRGARISTQTVSRMVKAKLRGIGLDSRRLTAHSLRHSAALQMLLNGAALEQVQQVLRHTSITTTMVYNHAVQRMKNQAEILAANAIFGTSPVSVNNGCAFA